MEASSEGQDTRTPAPSVQITNNRFLFVDVAAQRAKQLRRGALPRLEQAAEATDPAQVVRQEHSHKLERVAMEEVRRGIITYELPDIKVGLKEPGK